MDTKSSLVNIKLWLGLNSTDVCRDPDNEGMGVDSRLLIGTNWVKGELLLTFPDEAIEIV